jgi:hypothetical protein
MPTLANHHASKVSKMLLIGDSGSGKTGALASLANAGYNLRILDFDNGCDVLHAFVDSDKLDNVVIETLTDKMVPSMDGPAQPVGVATDMAYARAMRLIQNWKTPDGTFGPITNWGENDVFVLDSLTIQGNACLNYIKAANNSLAERDWGFYGPAMELQEKFLQLLFSDAVKCNVIIMAHIRSISPKKKVEVAGARGQTSIQSIDAGEPKAYPSALGNQLPPKVGRYFNAVLRCRTSGYGPGLKRFIETVSDEEIELKNPAPHVVPPSIPLDGGKGGLAEYFRLVRAAATHEDS